MGINGAIPRDNWGKDNPYQKRMEEYQKQKPYEPVPKRHPPLPVDLTKIKPVPRGKL